MKKFKLFMLLLLIIPCIFIFSACDTNNISIKVEDGYVKYSMEENQNWINLISLEELKLQLGDAIKGEDGTDGATGQQGIGIKSIIINDNHELIVTLDNHKQVNCGPISYYENTQCLDFYPLDDGSYGVGVGKATQLSNIVIPATYFGKSVTKIVNDGFANCDNLKTIKIPNSILSIGERAFDCCDNLTSVFVTNKDIQISSTAFYNSLNVKVFVVQNDQTTEWVGNWNTGTLQNLGIINLIPNSNFATKTTMIQSLMPGDEINFKFDIENHICNMYSVIRFKLFSVENGNDVLIDSSFYNVNSISTHSSNIDTDVISIISNNLIKNIELSYVVSSSFSNSYQNSQFKVSISVLYTQQANVTESEAINLLINL